MRTANDVIRYNMMRDSLIRVNVSVSALRIAHNTITDRESRLILRGLVVALDGMDNTMVSVDDIYLSLVRADIDTVALRTALDSGDLDRTMRNVVRNILQYRIYQGFIEDNIVGD